MTFQLLTVVVEITSPTLRLLKFEPTRTQTLNLLIRSHTPYPLGHKADGKSGKKMIKIPINLISSLSKGSVSYDYAQT